MKSFDLPPHYFQSPQYASYVQKIGWRVEVLKSEALEKIFCYIHSIPLCGSVLKIPHSLLNLPFKEIDTLAQKHKAIFTLLEPNVLFLNTEQEEKILNQLKGFGYQRVKKPLIETKNSIIKLKPTENEILLSIPRESTRRNIRLAQKHGLIVQESDNIDAFYTLFKKFSKRKKLYCPPLKHLRAL